MTQLQLPLRESRTFLKTAQAATKKTFSKEGKRIKIPLVISQGGTSSGKTYSILLYLILKYGLLGKKRRIIDVVRKSLPELKDSAYMDFLTLIKDNNLYNPRMHSKSAGNLTYELNSTLFRFKSADVPHKKRGPRRDILYANEVNGLNHEDWLQLNMRTREQAFVDYNPSEEFWLHTYYLDNEARKEGKDYSFIKTTYKDNIDILTGKSFLDDRTVKEIENLINIDDYYYQVYVLGELAELKGRVYESHKTISEAEFMTLPEYGKCYAIDWGYNDPQVIMECRIKDGVPYYHERYYKSYTDPASFFKRLEEFGVKKGYPIYPDTARPELCEQLTMHGYTVMKVDKALYDGIMAVKKHGLTITETSHNTIKERKNYKWMQDKNGEALDKPVDLFNHSMDCIRYIANNHPELKYR